MRPPVPAVVEADTEVLVGTEEAELDPLRVDMVNTALRMVRLPVVVARTTIGRLIVAASTVDMAIDQWVPVAATASR